YCNFGCAYFILRNLDVQTPTPSHNGKNKKVGHKRRAQNRKEKSQKAYTAQRVYDINKKQPRSKKYTTDQVKKRKRRFTIRQKNK
ncbi:MAG: YutD family protein, partial [Ligilactobacillus sp.]|nr:YutD family protein [Ligilactobacillus sp.]